MGYSHEVVKKIPKDVSITFLTPTRLILEGVNLQKIKAYGASIKNIRKTNPYNGTGIFWENEFIKIKPGKKKI